jgi:Sec-independent protein translocase protein TatA
MNIFGIGPLEIIFVLIIGILVLGPVGMVEAGKKLGRFMRTIIHSTWWKNVRQGVTEIQHLPQRLIREAELEELNQLRKLTEEDMPSIGGQSNFPASSWSTGQPSKADPDLNTIPPESDPNQDNPADSPENN